MITSKMINTITPAGMTLVNNAALVNPSNPTVIGALHRVDATGIYVLLSAGTLCTVPQAWARKHDNTIDAE